MKNALSTKKRWLIAGAAAALLVLLLTFYGLLWYTPSDSREALLKALPTDATSVLYADFRALRSSGFLKEFFSWAPRPQIEAEYAEFLRATGFDYERDLDRIAIALQQSAGDTVFFAVSEGRFDRAKISAYAAKFGASEKTVNGLIFSVPVANGSRPLKFTFLRNDRIALTNAPSLLPYLDAQEKKYDREDWNTRFSRVAGSPVFVLIRQDSATAREFARQTPGGWRSPQLSALFEQLQWISVAAKPDSTGLRVVAEGECTSEQVMRQLSDLLRGVVLLAQSGLNDTKARQQMDPQAREAYLELLQSTEVTSMDRGTTKSVRVVLSVTPKFLAIARSDHASNPKAVGTL